MTMMGYYSLLTVTVLLGALSLSHVAHSLSIATASSDFGQQVTPPVITLPDNLEPMDAMVILCHRNHELLDDCATVPTLMQHFGNVSKSNDDVFSRKKRSFYDFSSSGFPHFPSFPSTGSGYNRETVRCPRQRNQSAVYQLSFNRVGFPVANIATELANSGDLLPCLMRQTVLDTQPPMLFNDEFLSRSNATCPFMERRLLNYFSVNQKSRCFPLLNFQEDIIYKECLSGMPDNCMRNSRHDFFQFGSFFNRNSTRNVNRCQVEYERVSLWAYCSLRSAGHRIVRDRIIVPKACTPFSVPCNVTSNW